MLKLSCRPLAFTSYKPFLKDKSRSGASLPASFSAWFLKKIISFVIFYYLGKCHCLVVFTLRDVGQYVYCIFRIFLYEHKHIGRFKNHTQNAVEILFSDTFLKNQNFAHLWINSLTFHTVFLFLLYTKLRTMKIYRN